MVSLCLVSVVDALELHAVESPSRFSGSLLAKQKQTDGGWLGDKSVFETDKLFLGDCVSFLDYLIFGIN